MASFHLSPAVADAFPGTLIALVTATGLRGHQPWPETDTAVAELERQLADGAWQPADESDPRIAAWHTAYRSFGTNPRRVRPSVDALGRRLAKKGALPRINPAVDSYNAVSVRHALPAGAFDLDQVTGDVHIRHADGTESFTPLGEPGTVEHPKPGEIVYADATGVLTRHWNHRDAHRTRVTEDSVRVAFILETLHATRDGHLVKATAEELRALLAPHAEATTVQYLAPAQPQVAV
ncbi:B3/B4 domain-containing protein [Streptantibioticus cattleyicolor]|uniref:Solo B3/4 domain-containing protein n=1 Tax=Streptantibioticus cattleyicolor (strain ATCC 35852 / DSM 46488 / JCM 4925 / NBRC 14057 / NRRL 8057) TaxID=1003195 RepID=F8JNK5_STREN|nr:phenylalanine--tRNA ligase beta subunit-related protein [Streptantibioticus cattleyicolor]AEW99027.1 Solo B3/4 domain-containing protein [Streptantibioticus cattleyicolor NRRL 8057 = DSM 46488]CCB71925.1 Solo B3/4 domain (OB-fold DNA/RNA-binding) of Phe-aaRS-beta [Streptantibioticus cattleyicolor NRRL 8057 = DSM 46488]